MKVNQNIKLFVVSVLLFAVCIQAYSVSQIGDIRIEKTNDKWICDMIECPVNTNRCFVSKSNKEEPSVLKRVNICFSIDNTILAQKNSSSPIDPNYSVHQYINLYHSGTYISSNNESVINLDEKAFKEEMDREMENLHSNLNKMAEEFNKNFQQHMFGWSKSLNEMDYNFSNMFGGY